MKIKQKSNENQTIKEPQENQRNKSNVPRGGKREGTGRPKGAKDTRPRSPPVPTRTEEKRELRALAREHTSDALETLIKICKSENEPAAARVSAASVLLDRGYGKPAQHVEMEVTHYDGMSEEELREAIEARFHTIQLLDSSLSNDSTEH